MLQYKLIEDCIKEFNNNKQAQIAFRNSNFGFGLSTMTIFEHGGKELKLIAILFLLSRTSDGQAVMPFLNKKTAWLDVPTLDYLLYREFTEALRIGKTFDEALKIINTMYTQYV
jgi:hypothetical protein